ncbi:KPN_01571 family protein [unidentified bacterial endosymbiont]
MNPYLWIFIVLLTVDALRENLGLSSLSTLAGDLVKGLLQLFH